MSVAESKISTRKPTNILTLPDGITGTPGELLKPERRLASLTAASIVFQRLHDSFGVDARGGDNDEDTLATDRAKMMLGLSQLKGEGHTRTKRRAILFLQAAGEIHQTNS